jgi:sarcosine oxidase subunit gamma
VRISLILRESGFVHDLEPITALGNTSARVDKFQHITLTENDDLALASLAARLGQEKTCQTALKKLLGDVPGPGRAQFQNPEEGFWMGPNQWMIAAPRDTHELLALTLKDTFGTAASVTEQTGAWVVFDVQGAAMPDLCERLCAVPIRTMSAGDAHRTVIHQLGCFVMRRTTHGHIRIFGPRASAGTLHHAILTAAKSIA